MWSSQTLNQQHWNGNGIPPAYRLTNRRKEHYRGASKWRNAFSEEPALWFAEYNSVPMNLADLRLVMGSLGSDLNQTHVLDGMRMDPMVLFQRTKWHHRQQRDTAKRLYQSCVTADRDTQMHALFFGAFIGILWAELSTQYTLVVNQVGEAMAAHARNNKGANPQEADWDALVGMASGATVVPPDAQAMPVVADADDVDDDADHRRTHASTWLAQASIAIMNPAKFTSKDDIYEWRYALYEQLMGLDAELRVLEDHLANRHP